MTILATPAPPDTSQALAFTQGTQEELRALWRSLKPNTIDRALVRELEPGWLLYYLLTTDALTWGRWAYWVSAQHNQYLPDGPLPQIVFEGCPDTRAFQSLTRALDSIADMGTDGWQTMGAWQYFDYFCQWFLYGVGDSAVPELPREPVPGACLRLYQTFQIGPLLLWPYDYLGEALAQNAYGKRQGFFPTPHAIVQAMVKMGFAEEQDYRWHSVCDPCVGTGRMLLEASNYSLELFGVEIDKTICDACKVNAYLFAPWMAKPLTHLKGKVAPPGMPGDPDAAIRQLFATVEERLAPLKDALSTLPAEEPARILWKGAQSAFDLD